MRIVFIAVCFLGISSVSFSQEEVVEQKSESNDSLQMNMLQQLSREVLLIKEQNETLRLENQSLIGKLDKITGNHESLLNSSKSNNEQIKSILNTSRLKAEQQYTILKENIENSSRTLALSANVIEQLDLNIDQNIKNANDNMLSNPESGILGFKLSDVIEENAKSILFTRESDLNRFMTSVQSVSNSELVKNVTPAPALSIASSILNLLHAFSFNSKKLDVEKINEFEQKFAPYVLYYERSSRADEQFISANSILKSQLESVTNDLTNQIELILRNEDFLKDLNIPQSSASRGNGDQVDYLKVIIKLYSENKLDDYFEDIERDYSKNGNAIEYSDILLEKPYLKEVNNLLDNLTEYGAILEFIEQEYHKSYRNYNQSKLTALSIAPRNGENEKIIDNLKKRTEQEGTALIEKERRAIDIKALKRNLEIAKYSIKLI